MRKERILIVDDDVHPDARMIESMLVDFEFTVIGIAESKEQAIKIATKERPEIIIMDIRLNPKKKDINEEIDTDGIDAALAIQEIYPVHIIYLTNYWDEQLSMKAYATKSYDYLMKPVSEKQLLATITKLLLKKIDSNLIFVCYSHKDAQFAEEMYEYLELLADVGIDTWIDTKIEFGTEWKTEIINKLDHAKAAILLISIDFIKSKFISEVELPTLLKENKERGALILPIFVGSIPNGILTRSQLDQFQAINSPNDPIDTWKISKRKKDAWVVLFNFLESKLGD